MAFDGVDSQEMDKSGESVSVSHFGVGERLANWVETELDWETRTVVLGHLQRAEAPSTTDRFLTTAMGVAAARLAMKKRWGEAVVYKAGQIQPAPLESVMGAPRLVPTNHRWVKIAENLGIFI